MTMYHELVIDNFAGGGGGSTGIEWALGRPVDIAINAALCHPADSEGGAHSNQSK